MRFEEHIFEIATIGMALLNGSGKGDAERDGENHCIFHFNLCLEVSTKSTMAPKKRRFEATRISELVRTN